MINKVSLLNHSAVRNRTLDTEDLASQEQGGEDTGSHDRGYCFCYTKGYTLFLTVGSLQQISMNLVSRYFSTVLL